MRVEGKIAFDLVEQTAERVISEMPIQSGILNPYGVAHAGAILWFADVSATILTMGKTDASAGMAGFPLAINLNANFIGNQKEGKFRAISVFVKKGKTISVVRTTVLGENDKLIAEITTNHVLAK